MTWHCIYNISLTRTITLGPVYVFEPTGLSGNYTVFNGLVGTVVQPLGSKCFKMSNTGAPPSTSTYPGPTMVGITWNGLEEDAEIEGVVVTYDLSGNQLDSRTIQPLN